MPRTNTGILAFAALFHRILHRDRHCTPTGVRVTIIYPTSDGYGSLNTRVAYPHKPNKFATELARALTTTPDYQKGVTCVTCVDGHIPATHTTGMITITNSPGDGVSYIANATWEAL